MGACVTGAYLNNTDISGADVSFLNSEDNNINQSLLQTIIVAGCCVIVKGGEIGVQSPRL